MRLGILGSAESPYVSALLRAANQADDVQSVECLSFGELSTELRAGEASTSASHLDAVLVRTMPLGSLEQVIFRMDCLQLLEHEGTRVINPPRTLEVAIDKWLTLHRLQQAGIPSPNTVACQTRDEALQAFESLGGDCVIKPLFGGEGRGMLRVQDADTAWRVFSTLQQLRSVIYVQQFEPHFGYDIRVLLVGGQRFSMRRVAAHGQWKTNASQGSQCECHTLSDDQWDLAQRAAQAIGGSVIGVDLLPCRDGSLKVLEVNAVPGWRALERVVRQDIASSIVAFASQQVRD